MGYNKKNKGKAKERLGEKEIAIARVDGVNVSGKHLIFIIKEKIQIVTVVPYEWITFQGIDLKEQRWISYDKDTNIYDLGEMVPFSSSPSLFVYTKPPTFICLEREVFYTVFNEL